MENLDLTKKIEVALKENDWNSVYQLMCLQIGEYKDYSFIEKILYKKKNRPKVKEDQKKLIHLILKIPNLPLNHMLNCITAYSYKVIETNSYSEIMYAKQLLEENFKKANDLTFHNNIRLHRTHVFFSMNTVYWHILIYIKDYDVLKNRLEYIYEKAKTIEYSKETVAFYSTYTNIVRALGVLYFISYCENKYDKMKELTKFSISLTQKASNYMDKNFDRFTEYSRAVATISEMCSHFDKNVKHLGKGSGSYKNGEQLIESCLPLCIHAKRKTEIVKNLAALYNERFA